MCLACEMFWMVAEEPPPPRKRRARTAKALQEAGFACDEPAARKSKTAKPGTTRTGRRTVRVQSERRS